MVFALEVVSFDCGKDLGLQVVLADVTSALRTGAHTLGILAAILPRICTVGLVS